MSASWERLPREPSRAQALFDAYLSLGSARSLPRLARAQSLSLSYLKKLSSRWRWRERAARWQQELSPPPSPEEVDLADQARARQLQDALALQQLARAQLSRWVRQDPEGRVWLARQLTPREVARFWETGFHLEQELLPLASPEGSSRRANGEPLPGPEIPPARVPTLPEALQGLRRALHRCGLRGARRQRVEAKLLRWLWLPENSFEEMRDSPAKMGNAIGDRTDADHGS